MKLTDFGVAKVLHHGTWDVIVDEKVVGFTRKGEVSFLTKQKGRRKNMRTNSTNFSLFWGGRRMMRMRRMRMTRMMIMVCYAYEAVFVFPIVMILEIQRRYQSFRLNTCHVL